MSTCGNSNVGKKKKKPPGNMDLAKADVFGGWEGDEKDRISQRRDG